MVEQVAVILAASGAFCFYGTRSCAAVVQGIFGGGVFADGAKIPMAILVVLANGVFMVAVEAVFLVANGAFCVLGASRRAAVVGNGGVFRAASTFVPMAGFVVGEFCIVMVCEIAIFLVTSGANGFLGAGSCAATVVCYIIFCAASAFVPVVCGIIIEFGIVMAGKAAVGLVAGGANSLCLAGGCAAVVVGNRGFFATGTFIPMGGRVVF